jgi:hypothetical protein
MKGMSLQKLKSGLRFTLALGALVMVASTAKADMWSITFSGGLTGTGTLTYAGTCPTWGCNVTLSTILAGVTYTSPNIYFVPSSTGLSGNPSNGSNSLVLNNNDTWSISVSGQGNKYTGSYSITTGSSVPEPSIWAVPGLLLLGIGVWLVLTRRKTTPTRV